MEVLALVEGVNTPPPEEVPPTLHDNDMLPPLSRLRKDLQVGGRLAHFQNRFGEIRGLMGPLCRKKRVQNSIYKQTLPLSNSNLSSTDRKSGSSRRGQQTSTQRGSGEGRT